MILLVDKDFKTLHKNKAILEKAGYEVITSDSQKESEQIILKNKPDIAILELVLENMDSGFILAYKIKKIYWDTPVIIYTSAIEKTGHSFNLHTEADKKWIKADYYLEKGRDDKYLIETINTLIKNKK